MAGERVFDDDRWPDQDGHACCFLCGRKVDPRDSRRGTYTGNARAGGQLPAHLSCLEQKLGEPDGQLRLQVAWSVALKVMSDRQIDLALQAARCATSDQRVA